MDDSSLKSLKLVVNPTNEVVELHPPFSRTVFEYAAIVSSDADGDTRVKVQPTCTESDAFAQIQNNNGPGGSVLLRENTENEVVVKVDAPDGTSSSRYISITFSEGVLDRNFERKQTEYVLLADWTANSVQFTADPTNSKAVVSLTAPTSVTRSANGGWDVRLFCGDTQIVVSVSSAKGSQTKYIITARKGAVREQTQNFTVASSSSNQLDYRCPLCTEKWSNDPLNEPNASIEREISETVIVVCPLGCGTRANISAMASHASECSASLRWCDDCCSWSKGDHTGGCTVTCECGRKVPKAEKATLHDPMCSKSDKAISVSQADHAKWNGPAPWENALVNNDLLKLDVETLVKRGDNAITGYVSSLEAKAGPDMQALEICIKHRAAACIKNYQLGSVKGQLDPLLHLLLGLAMEEWSLQVELTPLRRAVTDKTNENDLAAESAMADEVKGLLEHLGVPSSSSDIAKLRAIEAEYHRLLGQGMSDQAAEVQNLYIFKLKQVRAKGAHVGDLESAAGWKGLQDGNTMIKAMMKYSDALSISDQSTGAIWRYGRMLLLHGQIKEARKYLQCAVSRRPTHTGARLHLGIALVLEDAPSHSSNNAGAYLHSAFESIKFSRWSDHGYRTQKEQQKSSLLIDNFSSYSNTSVPAVHVALARAHAKSGRLTEALEVLAAGLEILPDEMMSAMKKARLHKATEVSPVVARMAREVLLILREYSVISQASKSDGTSEKGRKVLQNIPALMRRISEWSTAGNASAIPLQLHLPTPQVPPNAVNIFEDVSRSLAFFSPQDPRALSVLGNAQFEVSELIDDEEWKFGESDEGLLGRKLGEVDGTFRAAIAIEDAQSANEIAPEHFALQKLKSQSWWTTYEEWCTFLASAAKTRQPRPDSALKQQGRTANPKLPEKVVKPTAVKPATNQPTPKTGVQSKSIAPAAAKAKPVAKLSGAKPSQGSDKLKGSQNDHSVASKKPAEHAQDSAEQSTKADDPKGSSQSLAHKPAIGGGSGHSTTSKTSSPTKAVVPTAKPNIPTSDTKHTATTPHGAPAATKSPSKKPGIAKEKDIDSAPGKDTRQAALRAAYATKPSGKSGPVQPAVKPTASTTSRPASAKPAARPLSAPPAQNTSETPQPTQEPSKIWPKTAAPRLGLARTLMRRLSLLERQKEIARTSYGTVPGPEGDVMPQLVEEISNWYRQAMSLQDADNHISHDAYTELAGILEHWVSVSAAADVYKLFPMPENDATQEDLFVIGELVRVLMKEKLFSEPKLAQGLIHLGRHGGVTNVQKYIDILDSGGQNKMLMQVFAGINRKPTDHPDMVAFFKTKFWL
ncbi:hypothetical protein BJ742DRAFT_909525 [Cladochytrium replicatum]|nr:hypothetical protein BJ742DRAFT_909525 [Cladochytrium replicatum]